MDEFDFVSVVPIEKGWSEDKKFRVMKKNGEEYLLRICSPERYEARKSMLDTVKEVSKLEIPMCHPVESGICSQGAYSLYTWIEGREAEDVIPTLPETEQYELGKASGEILKIIHSIPAPQAYEEWETRFNRKIDRNIHNYKECPIRFNGSERMIDYINRTRFLLKNRPQCFQHGDYHVGNMMLKDGKLIIIDFDRCDYGDPWEEFNRIVWCVQLSPAFAAGQLDGYFGGEPPMEFFRLLALYIASNTLSSNSWAIQFGQNEIDTMQKQSQDVLSWYGGMQNPIPTWYGRKGLA